MSTGLWLVVEAIKAIGAAAEISDKAVLQLEDDVATAKAMGISGGADMGGSGAGSRSGADAGGDKTAGTQGPGGGERGGGMGATVLTPADLADYLRALDGRVQK